MAEFVGDLAHSYLPRVIPLFAILLLLASIPHSLNAGSVKGPSAGTYTGDGALHARSFKDVAEYGYFDYASVTAMLSRFNGSYPELVDLTTAQDSFSLPDCVGGYKIHIMRITNETKVRPGTPEVLFLGGIHGDEPVSVSAAMYLAEFLLENYDEDEYIRYLVDNREIYIMPSLNPYGLQENIRLDGYGEDVNRDFSFDGSGEPYTTVGARAVHELMSEHLFVSSVNWHSGAEAIGYAWGSPAHDTQSDESPDDAAFASQARGMRDFAGDFNGYYRTGRNNQVIYYARGAFSDYAYAASWDLTFSDDDWPTKGARSLGYTVEISSNKRPGTEELGTDDDIYIPGGVGDGYIPKNIRLALYTIDTVYPYVVPTDGVGGTRYAKPGEWIERSWVVGGCDEVDSTEIVIGSDSDVLNNSMNTSASLSGNSSWEGMDSGGNPFTLKEFRSGFTAPGDPGKYHYVIKANVDGSVRLQDEPDPAVPPQSFYAGIRTSDTALFTNGGNELMGRLNFTSRVFELVVNSSVVLDPLPERAAPGSALTLRWRADIEGEIDRSYVVWSGEDPIQGNGTVVNGSRTSPREYQADVDLPRTWGEYFFRAVAVNESGGVFHSPLESVEMRPWIETDLPNRTLRDREMEIKWKVLGAERVDSTTVFASFAPDVWNSSIVSTAPFSGNGTEYNASLHVPDRTGRLYMGITARVDSGGEVIRSDVEEVEVLDSVFVRGALVDYTGGIEQLLDIRNVTVGYTESPDEPLGPSDLRTHRYRLVGRVGDGPSFAGELNYTEEKGTWSAEDVNVSELDPGTYRIELIFRVADADTPFNFSAPSVAIEHVASVRDYDLRVEEDLTLKIENISISSSYARASVLGEDLVLGARLDVRIRSDVDGADPLFALRNLTIREKTEDLWETGYIDVSSLFPGEYAAVLGIRTVFSEATARIDLEIPGITGEVRTNITNLSYRGGYEQELTRIELNTTMPEIVEIGPYSKYVRGIVLEFRMEYVGGPQNRTWFWEISQGGDPGELAFDVSDLPSGRYALRCRGRAELVFPHGGNRSRGLNLTGSFSRPYFLEVRHVYDFVSVGEVAPYPADDVGKNGTAYLSVSSLKVNSSRTGAYQEDLEVSAMIMEGGRHISSARLEYVPRENGWGRENVNISHLPPGEYHLRFRGEVNGITFESRSDLGEDTIFEIPVSNVKGGSSGTPARIYLLWILVIAFALAICIFIAVRLRASREM